MPKLPMISPIKLIKVLNKLGFEEIRQKGSHRRFIRKSDGKRTTVPIHNKDIGKGLLQTILDDIGVSSDQFLKILNKKK